MDAEVDVNLRNQSIETGFGLVSNVAYPRRRSDYTNLSNLIAHCIQLGSVEIVPPHVQGEEKGNEFSEGSL